ncbi:MAG TPA: hypothetical protein PLM63_03890 [bacterium]|nr:hypothetical protein [bacterium]
MLPIFKKYREMLKSFNIDLSLYSENKLWIDRLIIRGITKEGKIEKICRLKITEELNYEYKFYSKLPKDENLETYEETYSRLETSILEREREFRNIKRNC